MVMASDDQAAGTSQVLTEEKKKTPVTFASTAQVYAEIPEIVYTDPLGREKKLVDITVENKVREEPPRVATLPQRSSSGAPNAPRGRPPISHVCAPMAVFCINFCSLAYRQPCPCSPLRCVQAPTRAENDIIPAHLRRVCTSGSDDEGPYKFNKSLGLISDGSQTAQRKYAPNGSFATLTDIG